MKSGAKKQGVEQRVKTQGAKTQGAKTRGAKQGAKKQVAKPKVVTRTPGLKQPRGTRWNHIRDAAQFGSVADVQLFLDAGWPVDTLDVSATALGMACFHKKPAIVKQLLAAGANPSLDVYGSTPLMYAVASKSKRTLEMVQMLLEAGADPNSKGYRDKSLIDWIARDPKLVDVHALLVAARDARR